MAREVNSSMVYVNIIIQVMFRQTLVALLANYTCSILVCDIFANKQGRRLEYDYLTQTVASLLGTFPENNDAEEYYEV